MHNFLIETSNSIIETTQKAIECIKEIAKQEQNLKNLGFDFKITILKNEDKIA